MKGKFLIQMKMKKSKIIGLFTLCIIFSVNIFAQNSKLEKVEKERFLFGTYVKILVYDKDKEKALVAIEKALEEIARIDKRYNSKVENSIIYNLNNKEFENGKKSVSFDEEGAFLLSKVKEIHHLTNKKYDVTISPLMSLWGFGEIGVAARKSLPTKEEIGEAVNKIDFGKVTFDKDVISLEAPVADIDTGSFLKGYAIEKGAEVLKKEGIESAFVTSISSLSTLGAKPDGKLWRIGIQNPDVPSELIGVLELTNESIGISGNYQTYVEIDGKRYHHILDKETGFPVEDKKMVVVVCKDGLLADIYSTGFYLMKIEDVLSYVKNIKGLEVLIVDSNNKIVKSENIKFIEN